MSPNVLTAIRDLWDCAATTHNLRVLTPWMHFQCPDSYRVYEFGNQQPIYALYEKESLDDGTPLYEGHIWDDAARRARTTEKVYRVASPEAFFRMVDERLRPDTFRVQLSVAEHREFLQFLRDTFPEGVFENYVLTSCWKSYAVRPLVGRTLASLTPAEVATLPDNLDLYCLRNEGGRWWKTLGGDKPVSLSDLQADSYEGSKRLTGCVFPVLVRSGTARPA